MKFKKARIFGKFKFFYLENDRYIGQRVALEKYEPYETQLILRQTRIGDTVVDVGANIGYYTVLLADKVGKNGKVYAFEPDKINFEILTKNIKENNLKNVVAINAAVGSKEGELKLYKSEENFGDHKLYGNDKEIEKVKIVNLDKYFGNEKINLLKIDTQGWEPEVIEGAKELIEKNKPVMFLEYSPASYKQAKLNGKKMMNFLRKIYKKTWWIDEWLYICKNLSQEKIDKICATNKTGYADLWMKNDIGLRIVWEQYKDIKIKQWIKKMLFD
ncbi:MAG: FkbM family methyltransferase [Candidatus Shapirobacteria bacterium]|nr:FkbM family methyltransferase [Candidatus Shapirobacteria bacterium]